tara:strand:- start:968 stop:1276 length:309 start_codon:yes stop_codon:yes gene_type:complete
VLPDVHRHTIDIVSLRVSSDTSHPSVVQGHEGFTPSVFDCLLSAFLAEHSTWTGFISQTAYLSVTRIGFKAFGFSGRRQKLKEQKLNIELGDAGTAHGYSQW